ncbi:Uncharacterised protein [Mycobacteroides abscessus subsp. abscessus]|uniref:hypothetical protein n=1 Tax=Mycobacteroides abscessus TaxID=36809 RepID=UPI0009284AAA|nr:hypothetical protein [Mycobacteroides abscessus]SIL58036.1 Uncharacterised protein [Mycobacteroides abscessus subsp. abscessus]SLC82115.1 Uncharacterised protein [Mycobacteroides abscessus subsp. abscessus]
MSTTITVTVTGPHHADAAERLARIAAHIRDHLEVRTPYFRDGEPHPVVCGFSDDPDDDYFGETLGTLTITDTPQ